MEKVLHPRKRRMRFTSVFDKPPVKRGLSSTAAARLFGGQSWLDAIEEGGSIKVW